MGRSHPHNILEVAVKNKILAVALLLLLGVTPLIAGGKKKGPERGMLEKMEAVPCGARERGLTGLGAIYGSVGVTHVNSDEKLCPQYLLRTDEMEYHIRPVDGKHPVILPVGHEGEFKIKKDHLYLKVPDGDRKTRSYQVVSMKPLNSETDVEGAAYKPMPRPIEGWSNKSTEKPLAKASDKPVDPPQ
jgi:hypothetical protein